MENIPIDIHRKFLNINITILRYSGVWPLLPTAKIGWKVFNFIYRIFNLTVFIFYLITLGADAVTNYKDLTIFGSDGCYFFGTCMCVFKACKFWASYHKIIKLIVDVYDPIDVLVRSADPGILMNIKKSYYQESIAFWGFSTLCSFFHFSVIFLIPREKGILPIRAIYPFDTKISPNYELAIIYQAYCLAYALCVTIALDITTIGFIRWSTLQIAALTSNYKNSNPNVTKRASLVTSSSDARKIIEKLNKIKITDDDVEIETFLPLDYHETKYFINDLFLSRFTTCIKNHQRLIKIIRDLNAVLSPLMLVQFATSTCIICLNGYQMILSTNNSADFTKFTAFLAICFTELFFWCWYGNEFSYIADTLTHNQWISGWEDAYDNNYYYFNSNNHKISNYVTISMIPTMHRLQFKSVGIFSLSMPTFLSVVKSSYSLLIILNTFTSDK
nr:olfactory receptor 136 [Microplitis mediator]